MNGGRNVGMGYNASRDDKKKKLIKENGNFLDIRSIF